MAVLFALDRLGLAHALSSICPRSLKKVYFLNERHTKFFKMAAKRTPEVTSRQCAYHSNSLALIVEMTIVNQQKFTKFVLTKINMWCQEVLAVLPACRFCQDHFKLSSLSLKHEEISDSVL